MERRGNKKDREMSNSFRTWADGRAIKAQHDPFEVSKLTTNQYV